MTEADQETNFTVEKELPPTPNKPKVVVTDAFLSKEVYGAYWGFKFICPECGVNAIMVNEEMGGVCFNCFTEVTVVSATVDKFKENLKKLKNKEIER